MLNIAVFGAPGAGKGTQSELLIEKYGLVHISSGELLRENMANKTELGIIAKTFLDKAELVPDDLTIKMLEEQLEINKNQKGIIFDGFPRTTAQAVFFDNLLLSKNTPLKQLFYLDVDYNTLVERLVLRGKNSGRIEDESLEFIEKRISIYLERTLPVVDHYKNAGICSKIDGVGDVETINQRICEIMNNIILKQN